MEPRGTCTTKSMNEPTVVGLSVEVFTVLHVSFPTLFQYGFRLNSNGFSRDLGKSINL